MVKLDKRGWLRILESVLAIMILATIILLVFNNQTQNISLSEYVYETQKAAMGEIFSNKTLYNEALSGNESAILEFAIRNTNNILLNHSVKICEMEIPASNCELSSDIFDSLSDSDIYVYSIVVSANLTTYSPKNVHLFTWFVN
jgi:hypothetical protein